MPNFSKSASQFHSADDISFTAPPPMVISLSPEFMARIGALEETIKDLEKRIRDLKHRTNELLDK